MRAVVGNSAVFPLIIERVRDIEGIVTAVDGILSHVVPSIACAFEDDELLGSVGWWCLWKLNK